MGRDEKYMIFGFALLIVGLGALIWGIASGGWILIFPAVALMFLGMLYVRIKQAKDSRAKSGRKETTLFPTHAGRPRGRGATASKTEDF